MSANGVDILTNFYENWSNGSKVEVDKHINTQIAW
jgi:hypothetical protein